MKIILANQAGACYGVKRALDMALDAKDAGGPVNTLGPLIHNPAVVAQLKEEGIQTVRSVNEATEGVLIIRSHGVVPQVIRDAHQRKLTIVDATCPHVARAQKAAADLAREGRHVIVVGEKGHPEVEGLLAYAQEAGGTVSVVGSTCDVPANLKEPLGVVVQTTQSEKVLNQVVNELSSRFSDIEVKNTICFATHLRQEAAAELAQSVDIFLVVGGRNSSNTTRLYEIGKSLCEKTYHIESTEELDELSFGDDDTIGITAGASTPEEQIQAVVNHLKMVSYSEDIGSE